MPKATRTPQSVWTNVFRRIVQQVKNDPEVKRTFGGRIRSWEGTTTDKDPFTPSLGQPILRLTPQPSGVDWYSEDAQYGTLNVRVEIAVSSLCVDDAVDLWDLLVSALRPGGPTVGTDNPDFAQDLVNLGAETGELTFASPAFNPNTDADSSGYFFATGGFYVRCIRSIMS